MWKRVDDPKEKYDGVIFEEDDRKFQIIEPVQGQDGVAVISRQGYSTGVHSWIIEFGPGIDDYFNGWFTYVVWFLFRI